MATTELQPMTEKERRARDAKLRKVFQRNRRGSVPGFVPKEVRRERDRNDRE
jgi:hypothetical protein